ncbi:Ribosomal RNA-processing protein 8 [Dissostichus eleginoides]|uniref:Ribosomal RNA-processing protein 8 n=1 Tax=Dissostichus eleginoides TaxID=100907 RepID=A0AAD9CIS8_DISEL|nr:Ribosomal RNA-processing protein 8 [Dissostichus eleginoides]
MFNEEEEWSDEQDAKVLTETVLRNNQKANSSTNAKAKLVGKKSLMRTLQTLGSVPEWKNEDKEQGSDSEAEVVPTHPKRKRKKKRSKRRKKAEDEDQTANEEKPVPNKRNKYKKIVTLEAETTSVGKTEEIKVTQSDTVNGNKPEDNEQLNRKHKRLKPELSKAEILKREKLRKMLLGQEQVQQEGPAETEEEPVVPEEEGQQDRSSSLRSRMEQRLESARFRYINEVLYSTTSGEAKRMFKQDPEAFGIYHRGYTAQVQRWPANPVQAIIAYIQLKPPTLVVADFGCGDCKIASSVKNRVHSFDLVATCELVTVCDMANVPLPDRSVDIAVFCLSLMGTNLADFLAEANRVLKIGGVLKIAEVASRFENVRNFVTGLASLGFKLLSKDSENKNTHFYSFELLKTADAPENIKTFGLQLRPCVYKKR